MPSSTFNSDSASRAPALKWSRAWIGTIFLVIATVLSAEAFWRANGLRPTIVDDPVLWSYHRRQVTDKKSQVVLLGRSRMQGGFSMRVFHDRFPTAPIALLAKSGIGTYPIAALRDLAEDEGFRGTVICSMTADCFESVTWEHLQEYVDQFHNSGLLGQLLEPVLKSWLENHFIVLNPKVSLIRVIEEKIRYDRMARPMGHVLRFDRSPASDFSFFDHDEGRPTFRIGAGRSKPHLSYPRFIIGVDRPNPLPSYESWSKDATVVGSLVHRIRKRGGVVVFVRFPTTGERWENDEKVYPKQVYWDQLERLTGAKTIHFRDVPSLAHFDCPDTSHLDYRDSPKFTAALLDELVKLRILSEDQNQ